MSEVRSDAQLIAASLAEADAFAVVFRRHHAAIYRYLARQVGASQADDLAAETFVLAFRRRAAYEPIGADARAWLFGIATNLLRHHRRSLARGLRALERAAVQAGSALSVGGAQEDAPDRVDAAREARIAAGVLQAMPSGEREALLLLAWAQLSYGEIAVALGVPDGTVRSRINRARRRLREALTADQAMVAAIVEGRSHA